MQGKLELVPWGGDVVMRAATSTGKNGDWEIQWQFIKTTTSICDEPNVEITAAGSLMDGSATSASYKGSLKCVKQIRAPSGKEIKITFNRMALHDSGDCLEIIDGYVKTGFKSVAAQFCGSRSTAPTSLILHSGGALLTWKTSSSGSLTGWDFSWAFTSKPASSTTRAICAGNVLTGSKGVLADAVGSGSANYFHGTVCTSAIVGLPGSVVKLHFKTMSIRGSATLGLYKSDPKTYFVTNDGQMAKSSETYPFQAGHIEIFPYSAVTLNWATTKMASYPVSTGWELDWSFDTTIVNVCEASSRVVSFDKGTIMDGSSTSGSYKNARACTKTITAPEGKEITLTFERMSLEDSGDCLEVYDGKSAPASSASATNLAAEFCGETNTNPGKLVLHSGSTTLKWNTGSSGIATGWSASWAFTPRPGSSTPQPTTPTVTTTKAALPDEPSCITSTSSAWAISGTDYCFQLGLQCTGLLYYGSDNTCGHGDVSTPYDACWGSKIAECCQHGVSSHAGSASGQSAFWKCTSAVTETPVTTAMTITTTSTTTPTSTTTRTSSKATAAAAATTRTTATDTISTATATTTTTTATIIFSPDNVSCVEIEDVCTSACETASKRNYKVLVLPEGSGRKCVGPSDCHNGDEGCQSTTTATTATTIETSTVSTETITPLTTRHGPTTGEEVPPYASSDSRVDSCNAIKCSYLCIDDCGWSLARSGCFKDLKTEAHELGEGEGDCKDVDPTSMPTGLPISTGTAKAKPGRIATTIILSLLLVALFAAGMFYLWRYGLCLGPCNRREQPPNHPVAALLNPVYVGPDDLSGTRVAMSPRQLPSVQLLGDTTECSIHI